MPKVHDLQHEFIMNLAHFHLILPTHSLGSGCPRPLLTSLVTHRTDRRTQKKCADESGLPSTRLLLHANRIKPDYPKLLHLTHSPCTMFHPYYIEPSELVLEPPQKLPPNYLFAPGANGVPAFTYRSAVRECGKAPAGLLQNYAKADRSQSLATAPHPLGPAL